MIRNLLVILLFCDLAYSKSPIYGCFYNKKNRIANISYFNQWWKHITQGNITKSSYTLITYRSELGNSFIIFNCSLIDVTSTNAMFLFEPQKGSSITYTIFCIILVQTCSGYIQIQLKQYDPIQFSLPPAIMTNSYFLVRVNLTSTITNDTLNYQNSADLSSFYLTAIGSRMNLGIESLTVLSDRSRISVNMLSSQGFNNVITRIWFTLILLYMPSFCEQVSTCTGRQLYSLIPTGTINNISNFRIPATFNQGYFNQQYVFPIIKVFADSTNRSIIVITPQQERHQEQVPAKEEIQTRKIQQS